MHSPARTSTLPTTVSPLLEVIYEDADLLVVNKPAGLVCHPTKGDAYSSLISRARLHVGPTGECRLVNRLDRETSGVVLFAKTVAAAREIGRAFEAGTVQKTYLAAVHGWVAEESGEVNAPLGKDERSLVAIKDCVRPDGVSAQTTFETLERFTRNVPGTESPLAFSLLRVRPRTGRKHQIRIHLAHIGHAIVGDKLYGADESCYLAFVERRLTEAQRSQLILSNHALHAAETSFTWRDQAWNFQAEPGPKLRRFFTGTT